MYNTEPSITATSSAAAQQGRTNSSLILTDSSKGLGVWKCLPEPGGDVLRMRFRQPDIVSCDASASVQHKLPGRADPRLR